MQLNLTNADWCAIMDLEMVQRVMAVLIMLMITYMYFYEDDDEE